MAAVTVHVGLLQGQTRRFAANHAMLALMSEQCQRDTEMRTTYEALRALAVERNDIYTHGILHPAVLDAAQPMEPAAVMRALGVTGAELVALVRHGKIARPGKRGGDRVAWRADDIYPHRDWIRDRRDDGLTVV